MLKPCWCRSTGLSMNCNRYVTLSPHAVREHICPCLTSCCAIGDVQEMAEGPLDIEDLPGVGPSTADKLREAGYISVESIATASPAELSEISEISESTAKKIIKACTAGCRYRWVQDRKRHLRTAKGCPETIVPCSGTRCPDGRGTGDPGYHRDVR